MKGNNKVILGICCFNHDASAALIKNNELVAFAEEERFNNQKHSPAFPKNSIRFCLDKAGCNQMEITDVSFYFNPKKCFLNYLIKNQPLALIYNPSIFHRKRFFYEWAWLLNFYSQINTIKIHLNNPQINLHFVDHHDSHIFYAAYAAPFTEGVVLSNDSVGEGIASLAVKVSRSKNSDFHYKTLLQQKDPHSIGYLYGAVTEYLGYKRGDGEGKVMALASFGTSKYNDFFNQYVSFQGKGKFRISSKLLLDRSFRPRGQRLGKAFYSCFGPARKTEELIEQTHYDIAYGLQKITEKVILHQVEYLSKFSSKLCLTGGVAQNSVANGEVTMRYPEMDVFVPPVPHDAGCSIGAALKTYYMCDKKMPLKTETAFLGPSYTNDQIIKFLKNSNIQYSTPANIIGFIVEELARGKVLAFFRGRMEGGPRALCNRSIIADPSFVGIRDHLNENVKFREKFRPYGGFMLSKDFHLLFDVGKNDVQVPYMSFVFPLKKQWQEKIPSLNHVDGTCRIQTINEEQDLFLVEVINAYKNRKNIPILINTSLNIQGRPIARTPEDAVFSFFGSAIDFLIFNEKIVVKK